MKEYKEVCRKYEGIPPTMQTLGLEKILRFPSLYRLWDLENRAYIGSGIQKSEAKCELLYIAFSLYKDPETYKNSEDGAREGQAKERSNNRENKTAAEHDNEKTENTEGMEGGHKTNI